MACAGSHSVTEVYNEELIMKAMSGNAIERIFMVVKSNAIRHPLNDTEFFPVEFSMAAFSLERGVIETYTAIMEPLPLPAGSAYTAKVFKEDTALPLPGVESELFSGNSRNYGFVAANVRRMIFMYMPSNAGRLTKKVVFSMASDVSAVTGTFKWLGANCGDPSLAKFLVDIVCLDLSRLFLRLSLYANNRNPSFANSMVKFQLASVAEKLLNRPNRWSFRNEITCWFHCDTGSDKMDMCAKNYILRRIFVILMEFVDALGIKKLDGHDVVTYPAINYVPKIENYKSRSVCPFLKKV